MAFPLTIKDATFGVLLIEEAPGGRRFRNRRIEILTGVAQQAALAIQNDLFEQEMRVRERLELEVQLAKQIQQTLMPDSLPRHAGWELDSRWRTARQVGGDFFDVLTLPGNRLGLFIADVADKGMPAALFMVLTRTLLRATVIDGKSPADVMCRLNDLLYPDTQQGMFVTAAYGELDLETGVFIYANAGHNPPIWIHNSIEPNDKKLELLTRTGMALGVVEGTIIGQRSMQFEPGDHLLFYTDGVTEAFSPDGEMFGEEKLFNLVNQKTHSIMQMLDNIDHALDQFIDTDMLADDVTMLAVRRLD
jgi:serine phosphatase RsbU (regulator of sigma subunit)